MKKLLFASAAVGIVGWFALVACVGDEPNATTTGTLAEGQLGGPCFANGTCNGGLTCGLVNGAAQCVTPTGTTNDAGTDPTQPTTPTTPEDSGTKPTACSFQTTAYPCKAPDNPPVACYGDTLSCTLTGCGGPTDIRWECNSPRQCNEGPCCVPADKGTFTFKGCTEGSLFVTSSVSEGAVCATTPACAAGSTPLCQANSDCPSGLRCVPVKVANGGTAFNGTILGACAP